VVPLPTPAEANSTPDFCFASAIRSRIELTPSEGETTTRPGWVAISEMPAKSRSVS
jgi:hypothetical protein